MSISILLSILFELFEKKRVTAVAIAQKYGISERSVYRYIDKLAAFLPLHILRGRRGGIYLSTACLLPVGFLTEEEHEATLATLRAAYGESGNELLLSALRKLTEAEKQRVREPVTLEAGQILVRGREDEALRPIKIGLKEKRRLHILYEVEGRPEGQTVEPHLLLFEDGAWQLYAFCHRKRAFQFFALSNILGIAVGEESFRPRPFSLT